MQEGPMQALWRTSHISGGNADYVEDLYEQYLQDPNAVPDSWRSYFDSLPRVSDTNSRDIPHSTIRDHFELLGKHRARPVAAPGSGGANIDHERKQVKVLQLISSYRFRGHQHAKLDPLNLEERPRVPDLDLAFHNMSAADLDTTFQTGPLFFGKDEMPLGEMIDALESTYCGSIGAEIMHITDLAEKQWFQQRLESVRSKPAYTSEVKKQLLERMTAAEGLERHLDSKYPGTKRFGIEGGEALIPLMSELIQRAGSYGAKEVVMGMPHRGRLNLLVNIMGKNPADLFDEFDGKSLVDSSGDVKYHQGFSSNVMTPGGELHLAMAFNPSHLEIVSPVVEGSVRARQDRRKDKTGDKVVPIIMHGDAAFAGQGVVMETFQMSQTRGYGTGGSVHVVVNNQVGFTTSKQEDARSTEYCTDIAKMVQAPIFHVNADDPEAVLFVTQLAMDYRYEFKRDVVIDLVCYRRRGHNETDEPSGTQPLMYNIIRKHKTARTKYAEQLIAENVLSKADTDAMAKGYRSALDEGKDVALGLVTEPDSELFVNWSPFLGHDWTAEGATAVEPAELAKVATSLTHIPDGIKVQRQVQKIYEDRKKMAQGALPLNWGMAESLAYATLLNEGHFLRFTGQDCGRGTFSHRHAVVHSQNDGATYMPLANISDNQGMLEFYDSFLSEEAVLAFEYGYATTQPNGLVVWEAQFGDFANGAQVVIDQFIASGEVKWQRMCGLTMLLPHGYEGQGPEHSSARLERFLQLCAEHNMQVCTPTTPAQIFHILRRQVIRPMRRPLVIMSPKWILRHPLATSTIDELSSGEFEPVLQDPHADPEKVKRIVLCSGKVYYHLHEARLERGQDDVALIRIEQLYPFPEEMLTQALEPYYTNANSIVWCQEEPKNQGAWYNSQHRLRAAAAHFNDSLYLDYVGRESSAAPAAGYMSLHLAQQKAFVDEALDS